LENEIAVPLFASKKYHPTLAVIPTTKRTRTTIFVANVEIGFKPSPTPSLI
jgi:hypothetical protein